MVLNDHLNLYLKVNNSQWLLCSKKTGIKCGHYRYLVYKVLLILLIDFMLMYKLLT